MMTRTQIYLPEDIHTQLLQMAATQNTTLSNLVRHGANLVLKKRGQKRDDALKKALKFWANPPKSFLIDLKGKTAVQIIREDRDDD